MIKIIHCISDTNFGGAGRVLLNYLSHFDENTFAVTVVLPKGSKLLEYMHSDRYRIIELDGLYDRSYDRADVKALKRLFKQLKPDIVHSHGALSARIAGKRCGAKVIYTRHSVFDLPAWQTSVFGRIMLGTMNNRYADKIIAVSPAAKDLLIDTGTDPKRIEVVFNGVEQVNAVSQDRLPELQKQYDVTNEDFVCSIVARLEEVKGHRYLIDAAKQLAGQNIKILIAGTGGIEEQLVQYVRETDTQDIVHFVGFVKNIADLLSVTDLQINASYGTEATSMALLEGFSIGLPAVVSDFGGNPYIVREGKNGLIVPKKDAHALSAAICRMKEDRDLYLHCSDGAKELYQETFTAQKMTKHTEQIYLDLIKEETR